ncbi:MAG TPA: hypothetical protein VFD43_09105 [Planctomycetota bacterium]|nr:hypothetical protein [Planctomycetota bacterium]
MSAPTTEDRRAGGRFTLEDYLRGQVIRRVETDVQVDGTRFGTELEFDGTRDVVGVCAAEVPEHVRAVSGGPRYTIKWALLFGDQRRLIVSPGAGVHRTRYNRGDGSALQQELNEKLVGQRILGIRSGGQTEEGAGVTRIDFASGDHALVWPTPTSIGWLPTWEFPGRASHLIVPGVGWLR